MHHILVYSSFCLEDLWFLLHQSLCLIFDLTVFPAILWLVKVVAHIEHTSGIELAPGLC